MHSTLSTKYIGDKSGTSFSFFLVRKNIEFIRKIRRWLIFYDYVIFSISLLQKRFAGKWSCLFGFGDGFQKKCDMPNIGMEPSEKGVLREGEGGVNWW